MSWELYPEFRGLGVSPIPSAPLRSMLPVYPDEWFFGAPLPIEQRLRTMLQFGLVASPARSAFAPLLPEPTETVPRDRPIAEIVASLPTEKFLRALPLIESAPDPSLIPQRIELVEQIERAFVESQRIGLTGQIFGSFVSPENWLIPGAGVGSSLLRTVVRQAAYGGAVNLGLGVLDAFSLPSDLRAPLLEQMALGAVVGGAFGVASHLGVKIAGLASSAAEARAHDPLTVAAEKVQPFWEAAPRREDPSAVLRRAFEAEDPEARAYSAAKLAVRAENLVNQYHETLRSMAGLSVESSFARAADRQVSLLKSLVADEEFEEIASPTPERLRMFIARSVDAETRADATALGDLARRLLDEVGLFEAPVLVRISDEVPELPTTIPAFVAGDDAAILSEVERLAKNRATALSVRGAQVSRLTDPETGVWTGGFAVDLSPTWIARIRETEGKSRAFAEAVAAIAHEIGHTLAMRALADAPEEVVDILAKDFAREIAITLKSRRVAEFLAQADVPAGARAIFESLADALEDRGTLWRAPALVAWREWLAVQFSRWALLRLRKEAISKVETSDPLQIWLKRYGVGGALVDAADRLLYAFRKADELLRKTLPGQHLAPTSDALRKYLFGLRGNALKGALAEEAQRVHSFAEWVVRNHDPSAVPSEERWKRLQKIVDEIGEKHKAPVEERTALIGRLFFDQKRIGFLLPEVSLYGHDVFAIRGANRAKPGTMVVQSYLIAPFEDGFPAAEDRLVDQPRAFSVVGSLSGDDAPPALPPVLEGLTQASAFVLFMKKSNEWYALWSITDIQRKRMEDLRRRAKRVEQKTKGKISADEFLARIPVYAPSSPFVSNLWAPVVVVRPAKPGTKPLSVIIRGVLDPRDARALFDPIPAQWRKDFQALGTVVVEFPATDVIAKSGEPIWFANELINKQLGYARALGALHAALPTLSERISSADLAWLKNGGPAPERVKAVAINALERALSQSPRFAKRASAVELDYRFSNKQIAEIAKFIARASALIEKYVSEFEPGSAERELLVAARSTLRLLSKDENKPDYLEFALWLSRSWQFGDPETFASVSTVAEKERQRRLDAMRNDLFRRDPFIQVFGLSALSSERDIDEAIKESFATLRALKERDKKDKPVKIAPDVDVKPTADALNDIAGDLLEVLRRAAEPDPKRPNEYWKTAFLSSLYRAFVEVGAIGRAIVEQAAAQRGGKTLRDAVASIVTDTSPGSWFSLLSSVSDVAAAIRKSYREWVKSLAEEIPDPNARDVEARRTVAAALGPFVPSDDPGDDGGHIGLAKLEIVRERERIARSSIDEIEGAVRLFPEQLTPEEKPKRATRFRSDRKIDGLLSKIRWKQFPWFVLTNNKFEGEVGELIAQAAHTLASVPGLELEGNAKGNATVLDSVEARATVYQSRYIAAEAIHRAAMVEQMGRPFVAAGPTRARLLEILERIAPAAAKKLANGERTPVAWDILVRRALTNPEEATDQQTKKAAAAWREFFDEILKDGARTGVFIVDEHKELATKALRDRLERWERFLERIDAFDVEFFEGLVAKPIGEFLLKAESLGPVRRELVYLARNLRAIAESAIDETRELLRIAVENPPKKIKNYVPRLWLKSEVRRRKTELDGILARHGVSSPIQRAQIISVLADDPLRDRIDAIIEAMIKDKETFGVWDATTFRRLLENQVRQIIDSVEPSRFEIEVASLLGRRVPRNWTAERRAALIEAFEQAARASGATEEQVRAIKQSVDWSLIWEGLHTATPTFDVARPTRFSMERTLAEIPDQVLLDAGFLDPTITGTAGVYLRDVSRSIALSDLLGDPTGAYGLVNVLFEALGQIAEITRTQPFSNQASVLIEEYKRVYSAFSDLRDIVLLKFGLPDDPDAISARAAQFATASAVAAQLGMAAFSALADVGRIAMAVGLKKAGVTTLLWAFDRRIREIGKRETQVLGLAADVILAGRSRGWFEQLALSRDRLAIERWAQLASEAIPIASLLAPWTDLASQWATLSIGSELIRLSLALVDGKASKDDIRRAAMFGVDLPFAQAIVREWKTAGSPKIAANGTTLYLPSTNDWLDKSVVDRWRSTLATLVQSHGVIRAQAADVPKFMRTPLGRALFLYRSFALAATWKILASGLQQADGYVLSGLLAMLGIAYVVEAFTESRYEIDTPTHRLLRAIERSGALGIFSDINRTLSAATTGQVDVRRVLGLVPGASSIVDLRPPIRSRATRELEDRLATLSGAAIGPWIRLSAALAEGGPFYPETVRAVRDMIWGQNLLWWRFAVDSLEREVVSLVR